MRQRVDEAGLGLRVKGEQALERLRRAYDRQEQEQDVLDAPIATAGLGLFGAGAVPYNGIENLGKSADDTLGLGFFGALRTPVPYAEFRKQLEEGS